VGAFYRGDRALLAAVNAKALDKGVCFDVEQFVSSKSLSATEKIQRWSQVWFSDVTVVRQSAAAVDGQSGAGFDVQLVWHSEAVSAQSKWRMCLPWFS
jgi:hypothetical protein